MYRRIIRDWYDERRKKIKSSAYSSDSVDWSQYTTPGESIQRDPPQTKWLAEFQAKIPRDRGCDVIHTPQPDNYSHSSLTGNFKAQRTRRHIAKYSKIILERTSQ